MVFEKYLLRQKHTHMQIQAHAYTHEEKVGIRTINANSKAITYQTNIQMLTTNVIYIIYYTEFYELKREKKPLQYKY